MSEHRYWKCDRCGKKAEEGAGAKIEYDREIRVIFRKTYNTTKYDICEHCLKSFLVWIKSATAL